MRAGVHVRVDADADGRAPATGPGHLVDDVQLGQALDVEAADARLERAADLGARLADAREHDLAGRAAGGQHALQLAARDDVEAAAGVGKTFSTASVELAFMA
jgi:hypothetical protein